MSPPRNDGQALDQGAGLVPTHVERRPRRPRGLGRIFTRNGRLWIAWYAPGGERRESVAKVLGKPAVTEQDAKSLLETRLGIDARLRREIPLEFRTEHSLVQQTIAALLRAAGWTVTLEARVPGIGVVDLRAGYQDRLRALVEIGTLSVNDAVPTRGQRMAALHRQADLVLHIPYEHPLFEMLCLSLRAVQKSPTRGKA